MKRMMALVLCLCLAAGPALAFWEEEERVYITGETWECKWSEVVALKCEPVKYLAKRNYSCWSLLDARGNVIMDDWFDSFNGFYDGMGVFIEDGKYGAINEYGELVIEAQYESMYNFSEGVAVVMTEEKNSGSYGGNGYVDAEGNRVLGEYYFADSFKNGYAVVGEEGSKWEDSGGYYLPAYGVIDREGNVVVEMKYDSLDISDDGTVTAGLDGQTEYFSLNIDMEDPDANEWAEIIELDCEPVQYLARREGMWSLLDENYNVILPDWLDGFDGFENGLAIVRIRGKWGVLGQDGKMLIEANYDYIGNFCEGLARVEYNNNRGYINESGKFALSLELYRANDFSGGYATVARRSDPFTNYDLSGETDYIPVWGVLNSDCELIVNFEYDSIVIDPETGIATATKDGKTEEIVLAECEVIPGSEWKRHMK